MKSRSICLCNKISQDKIEEAIQRGCNSINVIANATLASAGQCGGSCRPIIENMLNHFLTHKEFLENPKTQSRDILRKIDND